MLPLGITIIILAISIVLAAMVIMLWKRRKQGRDDSLIHTYEEIELTKNGSLITEREAIEAAMKMNMDVLHCKMSTNVAYGSSLQRSTNIQTKPALYDEVNLF